MTDFIPRTPPIVDPVIRIAVMVSGNGTTLQNLIDQIRKRQLRAEIVHVLASKPGIKAITRAEESKIPVTILQRPYDSCGAFEIIRDNMTDLVVLGGFLELIVIPPDYRGRVINIHPSLIPSFCGKGYCGLKVHKAVLKAGVKITGCTTHFVNDIYDSGPIIIQRALPILENDTPERLAMRVSAEECIALPETIELYAAGRLKIVRNCVQINRDHYV